MELFQLRYFAKVLETGSISEAARQLHLSQPSLSFQIRKLEDELQTPLFERSPTGSRPTTAGRRLYACSQSIAGEVAALRSDLKSKRPDRHGPLRVGAQPMVAACLLPALLREYLRRPGAAEVRLVERPARALCSLLEHKEIDMALAVFGSLHPEGIRLRKIRSFTYVAFLPSGHALARRKRLRLADLWPHPILLFQDPNGLEQELYRCANHAGVEPRMVLSSEAALTLLEICAEGAGVAVAPQFLQSRADYLGLIMRPLGDLRLTGCIHMAWPAEKPHRQDTGDLARLLKSTKT